MLTAPDTALRTLRKFPGDGEEPDATRTPLGTKGNHQGFLRSYAEGIRQGRTNRSMERAEAPAQALRTRGASTRPGVSANQRGLLGQKTEETVPASPHGTPRHPTLVNPYRAHRNRQCERQHVKTKLKTVEANNGSRAQRFSLTVGLQLCVSTLLYVYNVSNSK